MLSGLAYVIAGQHEAVHLVSTLILSFFGLHTFAYGRQTQLHFGLIVEFSIFVTYACPPPKKHENAR